MQNPSQRLNLVRAAVRAAALKAGRSVVITERGQPVGRIVPISQTLEQRLEAMTQAGLIQWSGRALEPMPPVARVRGDGTVADLLVEDRD